MEEEKQDSSGVDQPVKEKENNRPKNVAGDFLKNIMKGRKNNFIFLKFKIIFYVVIAVLVFFALIIEGDAEETSNVAESAAASVYSNSTTKSAELYKSTGSLLLSTDAELDEIATRYLKLLETTNEGYFNSLSSKYSNKASNTVANKVAHITSNFEANETKEVDIITQTTPTIAGAVSPSEEKTIYKHILSAEKYNFNNIIWRSYVKNGTGITSENISFRVDTNSGLKYPASDPNAVNNSELDLEFFVNKVRPYLQSWYIPFDIMLGTQDAQADSNLNTDLAYEVLTSAYHEIVLDRYKVEKLDRTTNYLVYDKTTKVTTTTRTCADYKYTNVSVQRKAGEACSAQNYANGLCKDAVVELKCTAMQVRRGLYGCADTKDTIKCEDNWLSGCSYGVLKNDITETVTETRKYCVDTTATPSIATEEIRESKVKDVKDIDKTSYGWNYVISMAKMLDKVISNDYIFEPYYQYSLDNYNSFINKKAAYANMTVEQFRESEKTNSQAEKFTTEDVEYNVVEEPKIDNSNANWNSAYVVDNIPAGGVKQGSSTSKIIKKVTEVTKVGKEYIDQYSWSDTVKFDESKSGIYNVDSVRDVTGDDLTDYDEKYYREIYNNKELNLIDLMNSNKDIYKNYIENVDLNASTDNIGIRKSKLDISYNVLEKDLKGLVENYPVSGLMYGNSLNILEGLNLASIVAAGSVNEALLNLALSYEGNYLTDMMAVDDVGIFWKDEWCAMFVSFCMRKLEKETGITIPIPTYFGCTSFWTQNHEKPGFFDVQEWVQANPGASYISTNPANIAPRSSIQPGDIVLFSWLDSDPGNRDHTAFVKSVQTDESGNVIGITTVDGNIGSGGLGCMYSKVTVWDHNVSQGTYYDIRSIASFISVSTVIAEAEKGNVW